MSVCFLVKGTTFTVLGYFNENQHCQIHKSERDILASVVSQCKCAELGSVSSSKNVTETNTHSLIYAKKLPGQSLTTS